MTSIEAQREMNKSLVRKSYDKAFEFFNKMNELRFKEGLSYLTMPNLQKRFS